MGGVGGTVCVYVELWVSGCVSTVHPPPYLISTSVSIIEMEKKEATGSSSLFTKMGVLWVSMLLAWKTEGKKAQWSRVENYFNWRSQVSKCSQVWFGDIREQLLFFYWHKQNKSDDHDASTANYVLIFCAILTLLMNALCVFVAI